MEGLVGQGMPPLTILVTPPTPSPSDADDDSTPKLRQRPSQQQTLNNNNQNHGSHKVHQYQDISQEHSGGHMPDDQSVPYSPREFSYPTNDSKSQLRKQKHDLDRSPSPAEEALDALEELGDFEDTMDDYPVELNVAFLPQGSMTRQRHDYYDINTSQSDFTDRNMNSSVRPKVPSHSHNVEVSTLTNPNVFNETAAMPSLCVDVSLDQPQTSTPITKRATSSMAGREDNLTIPGQISEGSSRLPQDESTCVVLNESAGSQSGVLSQSSDSSTDELDAPIVGFEVMEQRARFTVFKIHVRKSQHERWFIFRRYTDFVMLNDKLKDLFPYFRLALPPKKIFGDNFDDQFLKERIVRLQAFINNIIGHRDACQSRPVRDFFCFDDPPGPHDSLEESRALCESLEEQIYGLKHELKERDSRIELLEAEVGVQKLEIENLRKSLRIERAINTKRRSSPPSCSDEPIIEQDESSCTEADQAQARDRVKGLISETIVDPYNGQDDPELEDEVRKKKKVPTATLR